MRSDPMSDTEIKDSVASKIATRGSDRLLRGLDFDVELKVDGALISLRDEVDGGDARGDVAAVLGEIGPGERSGVGDTAEYRGEN
jgi:hypothetical protein